ncbi:MAG: 3-oxoacyl-[acyl-carrier protein] reductase [Patiriisocius sp.]|jgi:3-oxoacyl-[acyl-carrier protein] reductase
MLDKTVLITGAGIGIGCSTAKQFAADGFHVFVSDILTVEGKATVGEIIESGGSAEFVWLDVTDQLSVDSAFKMVASKTSSLTGVINNAGIAHSQPLDKLTDAQWDLTMNVDLKGMMRVCRAATSILDTTGQGFIVCLSSIAGASVGWDSHVPYVTAKAGVIGLVRGLAIELAARKIRVNSVAPGLITTAQTLSVEHSVGAEGLASFAPSVPMGRIGDPEDIANVVSFLGSEKAAYMTGQTLIVDGGLTIAM